MLGIRSILVVSLLAAVPFLPVAGADHQQTTTNGSWITFDHRSGNEWWIEMRLQGMENCAPKKVEARDDGGTWVTLNRPSWGTCNTFVGSFHIEPGHRVQFRALLSDSATPYESCWFTHPAGVEQCSTVTPFEAKFRPQPGNEWWVEVYVDANHPLAAVEARLEAGDWKPLTKRSWGAWAGSFHAPWGNMQFRARDTAGAWDFSNQGYWWPSATPTPSDGSTPEYYIGSAKGNAWWIQVNLYSNFEPKVVQARVNRGPWIDLAQQTYRDWAKSTNVPDGSQVQFLVGPDVYRAALSICFEWPQAQPVECDKPIPTTEWPREGSYAKYETRSSSSVPGWFERDTSWITLTYRSGRWTGTCMNHHEEQYSDDPRVDTWTNTTVNFSPPIQEGSAESVDFQYLEACVKSSTDLRIVDERAHALLVKGAISTLIADQGAEFVGNEPFSDFTTYADDKLGMTLKWDLWRRMSSDFGRLIDTDAPVGPVLSAQDQKDRVGAWPFEGSHIEYTWCRDTGTYFGCQGNWTTTRFEHRGGTWTGACTGQIDGVDVAMTVNAAPPRGPATAAVGEFPTVERMEGCSVKTMQVKVVANEALQACCDDNQPFTIEARHAVEPSWSDRDKEVYWDVETRQVFWFMYSNESGRLGDTDANLT